MIGVVRNVYWDMLELGNRIKKVRVDWGEEILCSYPDDRGYGKLGEFLGDDTEVVIFYKRYINE